MNESIFEQIHNEADYLKLELSCQEMANLSIEKSMNEDSLKAVADVFGYLQKKKQDNIVSTLLRMSRLPLKEQKTFGNFDFDMLHGKQSDALKELPSLNALYAHKNIALIGPPGVGKTHLAMAYGHA